MGPPGVGRIAEEQVDSKEPAPYIYISEAPADCATYLL
jgi:hypothetical protein